MQRGHDSIAGKSEISVTEFVEKIRSRSRKRKHVCDGSALPACHLQIILNFSEFLCVDEQSVVLRNNRLLECNANQMSDPQTAIKRCMSSQNRTYDILYERGGVRIS